MLHSPVVNFHYCAVRYNDQCRPVNDQYLDVVKDTQEVGAKEVHGESAEATNGGNITIMAGMAGFFLRGWLPHRGKAQMACNYCFHTGQSSK